MSIGERGQSTPFRRNDALHSQARGGIRDEFKILFGDPPFEDLHQDFLDDEIRVTPDLYEVLRAFRQQRRPSA